MTPAPPTPDPQPVDPRRRIVAVLMALTLLGNMSLQIILPAMPAMQATFGASPGGVQLLVSLSFFVFGFAMLIYGPVADSYGRRPVYLAGMAIYTLGNLVCTLAPSLPVLILGRTIASAGSSVSMVLTRAIVRDTFAGHETARVLARVSMVAAVAPMIAPLIGGLVSDTLGWRALFGLLTGVGATSCTVIYLLLPETLHETGRRFAVTTMFTSFAVLSRDRAYVAYAINGAFVASTFFVYMTTAPFVYVGLLGLSATGYALYYMTTVGGFLVGYVIAGRAAAAHVAIDRALSVATLFCFAAAVAGLAVAIVLPWSVWSLTLPVILLTVCSGVVTPNNQAAIVSGDARIVGAASGLAGFVQMMVGGVLIQLVGVLPHATPYPMTGAMVVSAGIGAAAILWRGPPRPRDDGGTQVP